MVVVFVCVPIIDEYTRECLTSHAAFRIRSEDVKNILREVMLRHGTPEYIRSDNGSEFVAGHLREWFSELSIAPMYITPGSPRENGYCESVNSRMADEFLNREIFDMIYEMKVLLGRWVREYNTIRPNSTLGYRPPAPEAVLWAG